MKVHIDWLVLLSVLSVLVAAIVGVAVLDEARTSWAVAGPWLGWIITGLVAYGIAQSRWTE